MLAVKIGTQMWLSDNVKSLVCASIRWKKTCFFLQSDENEGFVNVFCYNLDEKFAFETALERNAELYARCIMK